MKNNQYTLRRGFGILLLLALLQACQAPAGSGQVPAPNSQTAIGPSNTPFQPVPNTPVSTTGAGSVPSETSTLDAAASTSSSEASTALPPDLQTANANSLPATIPPNTQTSLQATESSGNPTSAPPASNPTITPDIGTAAPPGDPRIRVSPFSGPIPTTYTFAIEKFQSGEQVTVQIISKSTFGIIDSYVIFMDGTGALNSYWTSQPNHATGGYYVKVIGANHGKFVIGEFEIH